LEQFAKTEIPTQKGYVMEKNKIIELKTPGENSEDPLTELLRAGARQLIAEAVEAELQEFLAQYADLKTQEGHCHVTRNGYLPEREIQTGIGAVIVKVPKVRDKGGRGIKFNSMLVPPYLRKAKNVEEFLPWLYLKGVSTGNFRETLQALLGDSAKGLSSSTISRCKRIWEKRNTRPGTGAAWKTNTMFIFGPMAFISTFEAMTPDNASSSSSVLLNRAEKNLSPSRTVIGSRNKAGPNFCCG
jgi:hypothetical protein